jgi:hypothetical protein
VASADDVCPSANRYEPSTVIEGPDTGALVECSAAWCADGWVGRVPIRSTRDDADDYGNFDDWVAEAGLDWDSDWFQYDPQNVWNNVIPCATAEELARARDTSSPTCEMPPFPLEPDFLAYNEAVWEGWHGGIDGHTTIFESQTAWEAPCSGETWTHPSFADWVLISCVGGLCASSDGTYGNNMVCVSRAEFDEWTATLSCPDCIECTGTSGSDSWPTCRNVCW